MDLAIERITTLHETYADRPHLQAKLHHFIHVQLPAMMESADRAQQRIAELTAEKDEFIEAFLNNNQYFYAPATEKFFYYDGVHYRPSTEDSILYQILMSINQDRQLLSWKQRTKTNIMRRIKDNYVLRSVPESQTIQSVLGALHPALFSTKNEAKYFLTVLGDNLTKKAAVNITIHFITPKSKHFLRELNNLCQAYLGINLNQTFRYRYHDHDYGSCRLVRIQEAVRTESVWSALLNGSGLDLLCVAAHYSNRYGSSDTFASQMSNDADLSAAVFALKNTTPGELVRTFIDEMLQPPRNNAAPAAPAAPDVGGAGAANSISWKNMQYLWKTFLDSRGLPAVLFYSRNARPRAGSFSDDSGVGLTLHDYLEDYLGQYYQALDDSFVGLYSRLLPAVQHFLRFWEDTMVADELESELEVGEIALLYNMRPIVDDPTLPRFAKRTTALNEKQILDLIGYFFPEVEVDGDKYIHRWRCRLWDKGGDIRMAMDQCDLVNPSVYDAYLHYCRFYSRDDVVYPIVNKAYFEKYVNEMGLL